MWPWGPVKDDLEPRPIQIEDGARKDCLPHEKGVRSRLTQNQAQQTWGLER